VSELATLGHRIGDFVRARVLCLGDVMLDEFVYGEARRLSPEAPIPVVQIQRRESMPGGAGNLVRNVCTLGAVGTLIGIVGRDEAATELRRLVDEQDRLRAHLVPCERRTTLKTRYVVGGQQMLRADVEDRAPVDGELARRVLAIYESELEHADIVVLSDYAKGLLSDEVLRAAIEMARARERMVIADPKSPDLSRYRGVALLLPNAAELAAATGLPCGTNDEATTAARAAQQRFGVSGILVTRSRQGMTLVPSDGAPAVHLAARAREVHDVSGAGDTVAATVAVALAAGLGLREAAQLANVAAGLVVAKVGTAVVYPRDLIAEIHQADVVSLSAEIVTANQAVEIVALWRAQGLRIGFTNGCFDLIHPGHVSLLSQARSACDRLIVGLNTDASARRLKGPTRPIQGETARSIVLASLAPVDLVILFDEDTPLALIERVRPDVLIKGADYSLEQVVGADLVKSYGGQVMLAHLEEGHSTTGTIERAGKSS
jgi:D-beta-D-heptose 7-phosphate kinase/D-beta-D-heptose 1-phosphate adenosyltransferase